MSPNTLPETTNTDEKTLAEQNVPLAKYLAGLWVERWQINSVDEREEMTADALLGLVQAARVWRSDQGVPFSAFARRRIVGAILNGRKSRTSKLLTVSLEALTVAI